MARRKTQDPEATLLAAAMGLVAEQGWRRLTMTAVADRSGLPLAEVYTHALAKACLLNLISKRADRAVLADLDPAMADEPARDRLFDILMRRFDALAPYRQGLAMILRPGAVDPDDAAVLLARLGRSMMWMLDAAGLASGGVRGVVRMAALSAAYASVMRVWLEDDSADLAKTMAALDRVLGRLESLALTFDRHPAAAGNAAEQQTEPEAG